MTYRQESEKDEEHALICLSAPKQMKHSQEPETDEEQTLIYLNTDVSRAWNGWCTNVIYLSAPKQMKYSQEPETDEEREKTLLTLAQRTFRTWRVAKTMTVYSSYKSTQAA